MTHGSLFDGFGGLRRGFEEAGIETKWTLDILNGQDITTEDPANYEQVDIISGGPPCIRTSEAARLSRRQDFTSLWPHMLRFIQILCPHWILLEQPQGGRCLVAEAASQLQRIGYGCSARVINSQHWVPQRRERWYLIARVGISGMALRNLLYFDEQRRQGTSFKQLEVGEVPQITPSLPRFIQCGACTNDMRSGISPRHGRRKFALMGAGNAVTQPVAKWLGERIVQAEKMICSSG